MKIQIQINDTLYSVSELYDPDRGYITPEEDLTPIKTLESEKIELHHKSNGTKTILIHFTGEESK